MVQRAKGSKMPLTPDLRRGPGAKMMLAPSRRRSTRAVTHLVQKRKQGESSSPFAGRTDPQRLPSSRLLPESSSTPDRWGDFGGTRFPCDSHSRK